MSHKLTAKQIKALHLLAGGATAVEVAQLLKMRRETLSRWKKIPEFAQKLEQVMTQIRDGMQHRLTGLADASISALKTELVRYQSDPKRIQTALNVLRLLGIAQKPPGKPAITPEKP